VRDVGRSGEFIAIFDFSTEGAGAGDARDVVPPAKVQGANRPIVLYYQTPINDKDLVSSPHLPRTVVYLSSLHLLYDQTTSAVSVILNDSPLQHQPLIIAKMKALRDKGAQIMVMLGGAGGAFKVLCDHFEASMAALALFFKSYPWIEGVDLDVEENIGLEQVQKVIKAFDSMLPAAFPITMAPVADAMKTDNKGLGGFSYTALCSTEEGKRISWFNVQCYSSYNQVTFKEIIDNGHDPQKLVFGMLGRSYDAKTFQDEAINELSGCVASFPGLAGAAMWECGDTNLPPCVFVEGIASTFP
jgi:hypothetical protein